MSVATQQLKCKIKDLQDQIDSFEDTTLTCEDVLACIPEPPEPEPLTKADLAEVIKEYTPCDGSIIVGTKSPDCDTADLNAGDPICQNITFKFGVTGATIDSYTWTPTSSGHGTITSPNPEAIEVEVCGTVQADESIVWNTNSVTAELVLNYTCASTGLSGTFVQEFSQDVCAGGGEDQEIPFAESSGLSDCLSCISQIFGCNTYSSIPGQKYIGRNAYRLSQPEVGINHESWLDDDDNAIAHPPGLNTIAEVDEYLDSVFDGTWNSPSGLPGHINGAPSAITTSPNWNFSDGSDVTGGNGLDQHIIWGFIDTTGLGDIDLSDNNGNSGEAGRVFVGRCCGDYTLEGHILDQAPFTAGTFMTALPEGVHAIAVQLSDRTAFGGFNLRYSPTGDNNFVAFPASRSFLTKPEIECAEFNACEDLPKGWDWKPPALCSPTPTYSSGGSGEPDTTLTLSDLTPVPDNDGDLNTIIRVGNAGTSSEVSRADHNHPIVRQSNPGDPIITSGGTAVINAQVILDRWSTEEEYTFAHRVQVNQPAGTNWGWINVPTIAGFQQPMILGLGTYRNDSQVPQVDEAGGGGGVGASPRGPLMAREIHHWSSTRRLYLAYFRRDNAITSMFVEFNTRYIRL